MEQLNVKTSKIQIVALAVLALFFVPMGLGMLYSGLTGGKPFFIIMGFVSLILLGVVTFLVLRGHRNTVRHFSESGVLRNDGAQFPWSELKGVHDQLVNKRGEVFIWRREIQFKDGSAAWLIPSKVSNFIEVREFTDKLDCEHTSGPA